MNPRNNFSKLHSPFDLFCDTKNLQLHGVGDFWCHKIDQKGNVIWRNYFGGSNNDRSYDAIETADGGYILLGTSESNDFDISKNNGSYDIWVVKISRFGDLEWEKSYGATGIDKGIAIIKNIENSYTILEWCMNFLYF